MSENVSRHSGSLVTLDPFRCRIWELNDRIEAFANGESCGAEIASIRRHSQPVPVVGRPLHGDANFDVEVICGARRLLIARHLKVPLSVELRNLTDRQAAAAVETENRLRRQTSPYERSLWLASLLKRNLYHSQEEMARELRITPTQVTRLLKFTDLPHTVIDAFSSPHDILESWAVELHKAWCGENRRLITDRAHALASRIPRPPATSVYETLLAPRLPASSSRRRGAGRVVRGPTGEPLLRFVRQRKEVVLRIPNALVDPSIERAVVQAVVAVLTSDTSAARSRPIA